ncbi:MAG: hypothetical protein HRU03_06375 [Nanoarchaeales archaeon]|nr:hypothetical protein [Nanoarchaeales archaeon]
MTLNQLIMDNRPSIEFDLIKGLNFGITKNRNSIISLICENYVKTWIEGIPEFQKTYVSGDFLDISKLDIVERGPSGLKVTAPNNTCLGEIDYLGKIDNRIISVEVKSGKGTFNTAKKVSTYFDSKHKLTKALFPKTEFTSCLFISLEKICTSSLTNLTEYEKLCAYGFELIDLGDTSKFEDLYQEIMPRYKVIRNK